MAPMRISKAAVLAVAVMAAAAVGTASAATYNIGEPGGGWDLSTNYASWVSAKRFHPGDQIVFNYSARSHDVLEVSKAAYDSCSASDPIATHKTGDEVIALTAAGTRYFICGFPNHCTGGMKVQIEVVPAASSFPDPAGGPSDASPPPPPSSAATTVGAAAGLGVAVLFACLTA